MVQVRFDVGSPWQVKVPRAERQQALFSSAQTFVAHEETLPPDKQSIYLGKIRELLSEAGMLTEQKDKGESQRTVSSEELKRAEEEAKEIAGQVQGLLRAVFPKTPERAEEWGLDLKQGTHTLLLPRTRLARLTFLSRYLAKEESRAPAERFTTPTLADVRRVRDTLAASLAGRDSGITQRESSVAARVATAARLSDYLQAALVHLLAQNNFTITPSLQAWGYHVVARQPRTKGEPEAGTQVSQPNG